ncbi:MULTISPECIES: amidohydrolase/deacetylase family metallohydrolase [Nitratireductor]|uniref:amidohydrolase/deacetylase family metallohydrolase n=1 Tax=Nitratireductor TaxID=245876 RepID=UPI000D0CE98F|nr:MULTISPECIES: amidohydrolase/deacetylase family metallohydrolase [Nitratireductor]PSM20106.1 amidohydrolase/deacetylase family metallohydrolase [Nitratireductor sp. StC3]
MSFDVLVRGGRLIDPSRGVDAVLDVGVAQGRVAAIGAGLPVDGAARVVDAGGCLVTPGLIDLHSHVYWGGTSLGVNADRLAAPSGTTTYVDAGSAGAGNFLGFRSHVMERAKVRIVAYLNISFAGIFGFSNRLMVGECADLRLCDPREAVACAREHEDVIVGMKVRTGRIAGGTSGIAPLELAMETADRVGLPVMAHIDEPPPGRLEVLERLRRGDVLTHCFRPFPNAPVNGAGEIKADMRLARERGVIFDIGHGMGSFDFEVARTMLAGGMLPDVISSDVHLLCVDGPAFDLLVCMSKLMALGMPLTEIVRATTQTPADAIGRPDLGRVAVGGPGDLSVLALEPGDVTFTDSVGNTLTATERLVSRGIVAGGAWLPNDEIRSPAELAANGAKPRHTHTDLVVAHFGRPYCRH